VEADDPERRRGEEYANDDGNAKLAKWSPSQVADRLPNWLSLACQKKAAKYGARANLVVYLNPSEHGIRHAEVLSAFPAATACAQRQFRRCLGAVEAKGVPRLGARAAP
jgi:hypothetical protein